MVDRQLERTAGDDPFARQECETVSVGFDDPPFPQCFSVRQSFQVLLPRNASHDIIHGSARRVLHLTQFVTVNGNVPPSDPVWHVACSANI